MSKEIRWKQRFVNFEKAFQALERTVAIEHPSEAERGGLIQFFEVAFELSWKTLKDYLEAGGFQVKSPRDVLKQAFQSGIIQDGHTWMEALEDRNLTAHPYNEETAAKIERLIRKKYFPAMAALHETLKSEAD
ncbi:MAG: nucleotidyltransferase substrate binding protein [Verrucomicrobia bacterium]|nr:nucleotidyltransferase substrate binding protein [Verrucomicrobiota bacterium]